MPILSGPNRGQWWTLASAGNGYATGRRALSQVRLIRRLLRPDDVVWDVGAHHGYVTLCAARQVRSPAQVHAFEPSALNRRALRRHLRLNSLEDVHVHPLALADFDGSATFGGDGTSKMFALGGGNEMVEVRRGADLIDCGLSPPPTFLKIDVEGAEGAVVSGVLGHLPPTARLLIAVHSHAAFRQCAALLAERDFLLVGTVELHASLASSWRADPDLFALGPACRPPSEATSAIGGLVPEPITQA